MADDVETKTSEVKTSEVKTTEVKTTEVKTAELKTAEVKTAEVKPVAAAEPPKVNPLAAKPVVPKSPISAVVHKPVPGGTASALRPGVKMPVKPHPTASVARPNPTSSVLRPHPTASVARPNPTSSIARPHPTASIARPHPTASVARPNPTASVARTAQPATLKPSGRPGAAMTVKIRPTVAVKPVIRRPGSTVSAAPVAKPVGVDSQGVAKLPTVEAKAVSRADIKATTVAEVKPLDALKTVTQKLKGVTQQIPQQAILRKTGIVSDMEATSPAQKEAAKHKTARISLSDAMGVSPVKESNAPMKTIRIKRPVNLPAGSTSQALTPQKRPAAPNAEPEPTVTQRKTLKITRPGTAVRPAGKFNLKKPGAAKPEQAAAPVGDIADIPEIPPMPTPVEDKGGVMAVLALICQVAACVAMLALAWMLFGNYSVM